jgi:putative nucleotidyltransferase with HDIG domain
MNGDPLAAVSQVGAQSWLVGGAVRDRLLHRGTTDFDVVVAGDPEPVARAVGRAAGGHAFELSEAFGAWRVVARDRGWQLDVVGLAGESLEQDLARRDLTVNAIAEPLAMSGDPAALVDPFGGVADLRRRRLRMVSERSFSDDPLRTLRLARLAAQLGFAAENATIARAHESAPALAAVAPERTFAELRALVCAPHAVAGLALMDELGATAAVLPELDALQGVKQSGYHHLDVAGHTRAVFAETIALVDDPGALALGDEETERLAASLAQPLANELTRGQALRFGALMHDIAKPQTRAVTEGRITFMGHDDRGAQMASEIFERLRASERLRAHVAALARHHLRLGFLVHEMPLDRRAVYDYLRTVAPVGVDVTVLSVADRLATRGDNAERAIARHLDLARQMLGDALAWETDPPRPPVRGDTLARALGIAPGPQLGALLGELQAAAFAGEVSGPDEAIALARRQVDAGKA